MWKYDVAVQLRDAAFDMLRREGRLEEIAGGLKLVILRTGSLTIEMMRPVQKLPGPQAPESCVEAIRRSRLEEPSPYGIDVWAGEKVFSVAWGGGDPLTIISFERGTWEGELLTAARASGAPPP